MSEMKLVYRITDGGRREAGIKDDSDCTVRTYALATGISYGKMHEIFKNFGRKVGKGTSVWVPVIAIAAVKRHPNWDLGNTLADIVRMFPRGSYILCMRGHTTALIDGVIYDSWEPKSTTRIEFVYEVVESAEVIEEKLMEASLSSMSTTLKILKLHGEGLTKSEIAKALDIRYQFVQGVISKSQKKK